MNKIVGIIVLILLAIALISFFVWIANVIYKDYQEGRQKEVDWYTRVNNMLIEYEEKKKQKE